MDKISKKEIRKIVTNLVENSLSTIRLGLPSDKTKRAIIKLSRKFSGLLYDEMEKQARKKAKALKAVNEDKLLKKIKKVKG